jgi:very-short-patch-repair endonuclease
MRHALTPSEAALWRYLSRKQLGAAFRRQQPVGKNIADFVAPSVKVIVEVDGGYHASRMAADERGDRYLRRAGYRVVRVSAEVVLQNVAAAVALVQREISG